MLTDRFALRNILDLIDEGEVELAPDFQRGQVWRITQKSLLVESLLLGIPLPAFYFAEDNRGAFLRARREITRRFRFRRALVCYANR